jgi:transposase
LSSSPAACERLLAKPLFIGVDVSKAWVDIADTDGRRKQVANEVAAIAAAFTGPWSTCANIVCEATGGYERALMRVAAQLALPLRRVHPNRARAFAQATGRLAKTDVIDAKMLAQLAAFTVHEPPKPLPSAQAQELAAMVSRLNQLTDLRQSESCRAQLAPGTRIKASINAMLKVIDAQIDAMQEAIDAFIAADPALTENATLLRSCKGVGPKSAGPKSAGPKSAGPKSAQAILAMLPEIGTLDRRKIAALVGVAPITKASGSSINHASIAGGRKALRDILFMAALSASAHNPTFKACRDRLKANGKPHKLVIVAVLRKLITTLNAIIKSRQPFKISLI